MNKIRTIIFGGSFDPIHKGHTSLAEAILERDVADEIWFMVTPQNPLKKEKKQTAEEIRLQMVEIALKDKPRMKASNFEFSLPRPSYTFHTLQALEKEFPQRKFILLIGADNWEKFDQWYRHDEILQNYHIIVYPRHNESRPQLPDTVEWFESELFDISSTQIRETIRESKDFSKMVEPEIYNYIKIKNLYTVEE